MSWFWPLLAFWIAWGIVLWLVLRRAKRRNGSHPIRRTVRQWMRRAGMKTKGDATVIY